MSRTRLWIAVTCLATLGCVWTFRWSHDRRDVRPNETSTELSESTEEEASPVAEKKPSLVIEPKESNQHVFEETTQLKYEFLVRNTSDKTVRILKMRPDCSCTTGRLSSSHLEPGETATFSVVYEAISIMGELPKRNIVLQTDDPDCPVVKCSVGGFRQRRFVVVPGSIDFGLVLFKSLATPQEVVIEANGNDMHLLPEKAVSDSPWITTKFVRQEPLVEGGTRFVMKVALVDGAPIGKINAHLFIPRVEDDGVGPRISVWAEISGSVQVKPSIAFMGIMKNDATVERVVKVSPQSISNDAVQTNGVTRVLGFGACPPGIHLSIDESDPSLVHVVGKASELGEGRFSLEVPIQCDLGGELCEVLLPINGLVDP